MENPFVFDPPSSNIKCDDNNTSPGNVADHLPFPPLDYAMLTDDFSLPDNFTFSFGSNADLEFNVDDLEFIDDLHFDPVPGFDSASSDHRSTPSQLLPDPNSGNRSLSSSPETNIFAPGPVDQRLIADMASNFGIPWDSDPPRACDTEHSNQARGSNFTHKVDYPSPAPGNGDQLSSQGSGEFNSGVSPPSPNSCQSARNFSTSSNNLMSKAESRITIEEVGSKCKSTSKRKKGQDDEGNAETRTSKFIRSSVALEDSCIDLSAGDGDDDKKKARLMRNRESAHLSRQRKKQHADELEDKVKSMHSTIAELNRKVSYIMAENAALRQQLIGGHPPHGMYPMAPMGYPWMPCPPYLVKPQGSQVPLVPIPRLKPQRPASAPKVKKKSENKTNVGKTKKVASVSFLGLLFFIFLFGGLIPIVNVKYGDHLSVADKFSKTQKGRILMVDSHLNHANSGGGGAYSVRRDGHGSDTDGSVSNSSEPLAASLYVPRNDKLVKIDGNLIIHSVLASERAVVSPGMVQMKTSVDTRLAIARSYAPSYHITGAGRSNARGSQVDDGRLPQWFREDVSGSMLSSGMCTEVFQFDVSPTPGSIVPATSIRNATSRHSNHSTNLKKSRNRRILSEHPIPLDVHALNFTEEHARPKTEKGGFQGNNSSSSVVVSVLVDPREAGEGDVDDVMRSKSLSRILVVVLIDRVKYVTYSCMLPLMGSSPHLVTTDNLNAG